MMRFIKRASVKTEAIMEVLKGFGQRLWVDLRTLLSRNNPQRSNDLKECSLVTLVEKARIEWEQSQVLFNEVKEPDLIDHAIYAMEAAERRYMYLLKAAHNERVVHKDYYYFLNS